MERRVLDVSQMMESQQNKTVVIVDPDASNAAAVGRAIGEAGFDCRHCAGATELRASHAASDGLGDGGDVACWVVSLGGRDDGQDALDAIAWVRERWANAPVVAVADADAGIRGIVRAMRLGVADVVERPAVDSALAAAVGEAIRASESRPMPASGSRSDGMDALSPREHQILQLVAQGHGSKQIARQLNISAKTVSNHRAHMLRKTGAGNTAELVSRATRVAAAAA